MRPRFKDSQLQKFYEQCSRLAADRSSEFYFTDRDGTRQPRRGAGHRCAYWNGRQGLPSSWPRNTFAHAAWAAGQDDAKALDQ
jgi:hypothetical protein